MSTYRLIGDVYEVADDGKLSRMADCEVIARLRYQVPVPRVESRLGKELYLLLAFLCFWFCIPTAYLLWLTW